MRIVTTLKAIFLKMHCLRLILSTEVDNDNIIHFKIIADIASPDGIVAIICPILAASAMERFPISGNVA